jgi:AcrR family transcriptional regulator
MTFSPPRPDEQKATAHRSRLTPEREAALYATVLELLVESGYEGLTMDAVATRAHTSKATIYRQWSGKPGLVAAAIRGVKDHHEAPDTGSIRGDLVAVATAIGEVAESNSQLFSAVSHAIRTDPELAATMRECMFEPNDAAFGIILRRAVARGEISAENPAISYVPRLFLQAIISRPVLEGQPVDSEHLVFLVDSLILPALGLIGSSGPSPSKTEKS